MRSEYSLLENADDLSDNDNDGHVTDEMQRLGSSSTAGEARAIPMEPSNGKGGGSFRDDNLAVPDDDSAAIGDHIQPGPYRVYRRRFIGLVVLALLNIVVSWSWLSFAAVSTTSAQYFLVSQGAINWLSTGFLLAFVAVSPLVIWTLNKAGPKASIITCSALVLVGSLVRYAGARATGGHFGVVAFGQIIIGLAQPFALTAPTRYSNMWFTPEGRVSATALTTLANPLGGALGQLIGPFWATDAAGIPNLVLYTSIIAIVASLPAPFIPKRPVTPPSADAAVEKLDLRQALSSLSRNSSFYLILIPFAVYVGFFNATSSLLNQIFEPYGYSETEAGIAGALLIVVGLVASAVVSPFIDRSKQHLMTIKILVPCIAAGYLVLIFMPRTQTVVGPYLVCAFLGATSFSLLPCALEYLVISTHPVSPEVSSVICWTWGQLLGAVFIIIMDALKGGWKGEPAGSMTRALIFQAVLSIVVAPLPLFLKRERGRGQAVGDEGMAG